MQSLARAWEAWRQDAAHSGELKHRLSHIVARWQQQRLLSSWNAYRDYVDNARRLRAVRDCSCLTVGLYYMPCSCALQVLGSVLVPCLLAFD